MGGLVKIHPDIECAIATGANVLISGGHAASRAALARLIHERSTAQQSPLLVVNDSHPIGTAVTEASVDSKAGGRTMFIEDLTALDGPEQSGLMHLFDASALAENPRELRLISGIENDVLDQLASSVFNNRLFYRLNTIHIVLDEDRRVPDPTTIH